MPPQSTATADLSKHRCSFNHDAIRWVRRVFGQTGARRVLCAEPAATCKSTHLIRLPISALITMQPISATWRPSLNTRVVSSLELLRISRESRWSLWTHVFKQAVQSCTHHLLSLRPSMHFECSETHITGFHFSLDLVRSPRGSLLGLHFGNDWYTDLRRVSHELII